MGEANQPGSNAPKKKEGKQLSQTKQIIIMAASGSDVSKGFCVNGGEPEHKGSTSFRLKITEDTVITVP